MWRNGPAVWISRKVKFIPQSSCEAEVAGLVCILKEAIFIKQVVEFILVTLEGPMHCIIDNKAARDVIAYPGATKRTNHFDRCLHFARELSLRNAIKVHLTTTDNMMADYFTKPTDKTTFLRCRGSMMTGA